MENKSKLNTVLLAIIIILLVAGLGYYFLNNSKRKEDRIINSSLMENTNNQNKNTSIGNSNTSMPGPIFTTNEATNITSNSATLNASIFGLMDTRNSIGQNAYFEYGVSLNNLNISTVGKGPVQGNLTDTINKLQPNTKYYFRAVVDYGPNSVPSNSKQYGSIVTFQTLP